MSNSKKKIISIVGWVIIIIIPLMAVFTAIELTLRFLLPEMNILTRIIEPTHDSRSYILKANSKILYQGLYEKHEPIIWEINQQGLRSDRIENKNSGKFRILTYGDSETFGWSINTNNSWQRQMELIDSNVEVLNFGIPGYNAENVADHMQYTIADFHPDMILYFFNKNDFYPAFNFNPILSHSYTYLIIRMGIYNLFKEKRKAWRKSPEGGKFLQTQVKRMIALSKQHDAPLYVLVMHWKYVKPLQLIANTHNDTIKIINIEETVDKFETIDAHLTKSAHAALAKHLCKQISNTSTGKCAPTNMNTQLNSH